VGLTTEVAGRIIDSFPPALLVLIPIMGFIMLFFSPINLFLPHIISDPFWGTPAAVEILGRFTIIVLVSFAVGLPLSFLETFFVSNSGLNNFFKRTMQVLYRSKERKGLKGNFKKRLRARLKKIARETDQPLNLSFNPDFWVWLKEKNRLNIFNFLVTGNAIVNGLLIGSEIALISNFFALFFQFARVIALFIISLVLFAYVLFINSRYWRDTLNNQTRRYFEGYEEDSKRGDYNKKLYS
jgi:hypothetical protein